ncbi:MAG: hypothetical protein Q8L13_24735 [Bradyrhizobium sp.]|uniref:hypothetical protein n=1 Tax=Bradyrhizobium sp. TaxID=376 RepID=UPI0027304EA0|nr:hypothetical protein [Bradyrhizobium sp.]MDP1869534.1 hypothetical protein [Bradyrhizobium sp.]
MRRIVLLGIAMGFLAPLLASAPASAQATRTWVSGVGDDANPCSRTAPCKTFAGAISKTATAGEINTLDPGGFGAVTITKAISIISIHNAGVLVSGTNGIIVNPPANAEVNLEGLDLEGLGTGINGIRIISAAKVFINKCAIRNFTTAGVDVAGPAGARAIIQDSVITSNATGVNVVGSGGASNSATIIRTTVDNNTIASINVTAPSLIFVTGSTLIGSPAAVAGTGTFNSFVNNAMNGTTIAITNVPLR